jgi:hypothetical protein
MATAKAPDPYRFSYTATAWLLVATQAGGKTDGGMEVQKSETSFAISPDLPSDTIGTLAAIGLKELVRSAAAQEEDGASKLEAARAVVDDALSGVFRERAGFYADLPAAIVRLYAGTDTPRELQAVKIGIRSMTDEQLAEVAKRPDIKSHIADIRAKRAKTNLAKATVKPLDLGF